VSSFGEQHLLKEMESVFQSNPELGAIRHLHPATFPIELPDKYIRSITNNDEIVTDPFLGSGTTLVACERNGRICMGMEISEAYCDVIISRYCALVGSNKIIKNGVEMEW
jgi:DNA modification methylase